MSNPFFDDEVTVVTSRHFDFVTCILSVLAGLLWAWLGGKLLRSAGGSLWTPLLIGLYFLGLALVLILILWLCTVIKKRGMPESGSYLKAFALALAVFVLAGLFQWIYSVDIRPEEAPSTDDSSYIFLIDESGSMTQSDMRNERATAIQSLMADCDRDFPYAVYGFSDTFRQISPLQPASAAASGTLVMEDSGLTYISDAIEYVLQEIESGRLTAGARPHLILVTDGYESASSNPLASTLSHANAIGVRVSTVGVGFGVDSEYLRNIAVKTGGNYVTCETMSELLGGMTDVTELESSSYERTLLNTREDMPRDWLYAVMRIIFLLVLAIPFLIIKSLLLRTNDEAGNVLIPNLILLIIGALSVEIGMNQLLLRFLKESVVQSILCVGFAILIVTEILRTSPSGGWSTGVDEHMFGSGNTGGTSAGGKRRASTGGSSAEDDWSF